MVSVRSGLSNAGFCRASHPGVLTGWALPETLIKKGLGFRV